MFGGPAASRHKAAPRILATAIAATLAFCPTAAGQTPGVTQVELSSVTGTMLVAAQPGVVNAVSLAYLSETNEVLVADSAGIEIETVTLEQNNCRPLDGAVACNAALLVPNSDFPPIGVVLADGPDSVIADASFGLGFFANGGGGRDEISGSLARDILNGGGGGDLVESGEGADNIEGGEGNDTLRSEGGSDLIGGGEGHDRQYGGRGRDWIWSADGQRDPVVNCGASGDPPAIIDRGLDAKPHSC